MGVDQDINKAIKHIEDARKGYSIHTNNQLGMIRIYNDIAHSYQEAIDILQDLKKDAIKSKKYFTSGYSNNNNNNNNTRKRKRNNK